MSIGRLLGFTRRILTRDAFIKRLDLLIKDLEKCNELWTPTRDALKEAKKLVPIFLLVLFITTGCAEISPQKKGTLTTQDRGTYELTERGDQLMQTGVYSKREVSKDFAEGYEKGLGDAAKDEYWRMQYQQQWAPR